MESHEFINIWSLRVDLTWAHILLRLVAVPGVTTPRPEVHYFLFDRYFRLSEVYRGRGSARRAERLCRIAAWHLDRSGSDTPPAAAALALPVPKRPSLTWALAGPEPPEPPTAA